MNLFMDLFGRLRVARLFLYFALTLFPIFSFAENQQVQSVNQSVMLKVDSDDAISTGASLFQQVCASCHGKDLSGASGFNLKDGEWIHGSQPYQIVDNIKSGFMQAGMPGFGAVFTQQQIESITAYVLSKRLGFSDLTYKIYQLESKEDRKITSNKLIKKGLIKNNLADFRLPEVNEYIIEFEGDFYTSATEDTRIWIVWGFHNDIEFESNGEKIARDTKFGEWYPTWKLKRGKQRLVIRFHSGSTKPNARNLTLIATNKDMSIKLFPVSASAASIMSAKKLEIKATQQPVIQRVKTFNLPPYSISVGLPEKINYAFNSKSCDLVGMWIGDLLNVGPNVAGRGEDASIPLGDWVYHAPDKLGLNQQHHGQCDYLGYSVKNGHPLFNFQTTQSSLTLSVLPIGPNKLSIEVIQQSNELSTLHFDLPQSANITWTTPLGRITKDMAILNSNDDGKFTLVAYIK